MQPPHVLDYIRANYRREGGTIIGKRFGMSKTMVSHYAHKWGLVVDEDARREHRRAKFNAMQPSDYKVNPTQFTNVTTPEAAYLLGLLWADGHIYAHPNPNKLKRRIFLSMLAEDMEALRPTINATGQWNWRSSQCSNRRRQQRIETSNKPLFDALELLDYRSKAASPDKVLASIPQHLRHYWFRGLFDGDGCIAVTNSRRIIIASCYEQDWKYMENLCELLNITSCRITRNILPSSRSSNFDIGRTPDMVKFCQYIYQGYEEDKIGLPRKRQKYEELLNQKIGTSYKLVEYRLKEVVYDRRNGNKKPQIIRFLK